MSRIQSSPSDHLEVDELEEMVGRLGSYGNIPEVPVANSARSVFFFAPTAVGDGDATTSLNAAALAYNSVTTYCTANLRDVCVVLAGDYNINGSVNGLVIDKAGTKVFGIEPGLVTVDNSNAGAANVITVSVHDAEVAGFTVDEATNTVTGIWGTGADNVYIHNNNVISTVDVGIGVTGSLNTIICHNLVREAVYGFSLEGASNGNRVFENQVYNVTTNGIRLSGDDVDGNFVYDNEINGANKTTDVGIAVTLGDNNEIVDNWIGQCTNHITDTGSQNIFDNWVDEYSTTFTFTNAMAVAKQTLVSAYDCARPGKIDVKVDISALHDAGEGGISTWRVEESGGGDVYGLDTFNEGVDEMFPVIKGTPVKSGADSFDVTGQLGVAATVDRIVTIYIYERG